MSNFRYAGATSRSCILADGVLPLQVIGSVQLLMEFGSELIPFYALVVETLCIDLILGMDFMIMYNAIIDVKLQHFTLEVNDRSTTIHVDDNLRRPLVPLHSHHATWIPPHSTVSVLVSSPFSSLSAYFIPASIFFENPHLSSSQKIITIQHHHSTFSVTNTSDFSQYIPQYFCFGYLLSEHPHQHSFLDRISTLCRRFNEEKNRQILSNTFTHPQLPQRQFTDSKKHYQPSSSKFTTVSNVISPSPSLHLQVSFDLLVNHPVDAQQRTQLSSLLCEYSPLFDNSYHNISNIIIDHVFNTVPHSPPAFHPHRNPHNREETQRLIDEFLEAGIIQESKSPYAALVLSFLAKKIVQVDSLSIIELLIKLRFLMPVHFLMAKIHCKNLGRATSISANLI